MGMMIAEADTILSCERLGSSMGCGASDEDIDKALGVAIDTMRKYKQIEQIVNAELEEYHPLDRDPYRLALIKEMLEDGNDD